MNEYPPRYAQAGRARPSALWPALLTAVWLFSAPADAQLQGGPLAACESLRMFAHRGHPDRPENSVEAVVAALEDGYTGAEIDIQLLADGITWVAHHDLMAGGTVRSLPDLPLRAITRDQWLSGHYVGTHKRVTTLEMLLSQAAGKLQPFQHLILELKAVLTPAEALSAIGLARRHLPPAQVTLASLTTEPLGDIRGVDRRVELAWVLLSPDALSAIRQGGDYKAARRFGHYIDLKEADISFAIEGGKRVMSDGPGTARRLAQQLGPNVAVIIDIDMLARKPELVDTFLRAGVGIYSYSAISTDAQHGRTLARITWLTGWTPKGVIVNKSRTVLCENYDELLRSLAGSGPSPVAVPPSTPR